MLDDPKPYSTAYLSKTLARVASEMSSLMQPLLVLAAAKDSDNIRNHAYCFARHLQLIQLGLHSVLGLMGVHNLYLIRALNLLGDLRV